MNSCTNTVHFLDAHLCPTSLQTELTRNVRFFWSYLQLSPEDANVERVTQKWPTKKNLGRRRQILNFLACLQCRGKKNVWVFLHNSQKINYFTTKTCFCAGGNALPWIPSDAELATPWFRIRRSIAVAIFLASLFHRNEQSKASLISRYLKTSLRRQQNPQKFIQGGNEVPPE